VYPLVNNCNRRKHPVQLKPDSAQRKGATHIQIPVREPADFGLVVEINLTMLLTN
jgi:hypothetical protein